MSASPFDEPLSAIRENTENLATWLTVWEGRAEPDAQARRCASDAVDAVDDALGELYRVRAQLVAKIRAADDATAARADELLRRRAVRTLRPSLPAGAIFRIVTIRK